MERDYSDGDYMQVFASDWKDVVCDKNGTLDLDKVARELRDYSLLIDCTSLVCQQLRAEATELVIRITGLVQH